ncbi:MAG: hypothetical protein JST31_07305 [Actinobacteria bacterium]|nr:hypothetical protein [Actinomycetota bacterium]
MDVSTLWRSALLQLGTVAVFFVALALALPKEFFVDWGWAVGPLTWLLCAGITARVLSLPLNPTLLGALLAGLPSLLAVVVGAHEAGMIVAVVLFALWCGRLAQHSGLPSAPSGRIE